MKEQSSPRPIFVGGTGRSGTTIFYRSLGRQPQIHVFPNEMRFLIDPGGLMDLIDSCTLRFSPARAREALHEFETLMRIYLTTPERPPYRGFDMAKWLDEPFYWDRLDRYCAELTHFQFEGTAWQIEAQHEGRLVEWARKLQVIHRRLRGQQAIPFRLSKDRDRLKIVRPFPERIEAIKLSSEFVNDLFSHAARLNGKSTWCEKTPHSLFHLDFIWEMFPNCLFVHIKRDPRGVVYSLMRSSWKRAPRDVEGVCLFLRGMYERWFQLRGELSFDEHKFLELKIEEVAEDAHSTLRRVAELAGLDQEFNKLPEIKLARLNEWQTNMSDHDLRTTMKLIGPYVEAMGYEV